MKNLMWILLCPTLSFACQPSRDSLSQAASEKTSLVDEAVSNRQVAQDRSGRTSYVEVEPVNQRVAQEETNVISEVEERVSGQQLNVYGKPLEICSLSPRTGWFRDGSCRTDDNDGGIHTVCASMTQEFLDYTKSKGNDLSTPSRSFPGLKPGDRWCLCAMRWRQAFVVGKAPKVYLDATHRKALNINPLGDLKSQDLNGS